MFNGRRPSLDALNLRQENGRLLTVICGLRREIENKRGHVQRLQVLLCSRLQRIDELTAQVDQLRHQNKLLDAEAEHLAALFAAPQAPSGEQHGQAATTD